MVENLFGRYATLTKCEAFWRLALNNNWNIDTFPNACSKYKESAMNSQSIKTFITLAKLNSFSQTATSLYISQSTVTKRICELEKEVGKPLFYRDKKHVSLTEDGRIFLKYATRIVELEEASLKEMHSSVTYENSLRIGSTNSIYECHLFPLISGFESASKKHSVKVTIGHSSDMIQLLMDGILDCVFISVPLVRAGFECHHFHTDNLVLATGYDNMLHADGIRKEELTSIKYMMCNFALNDVGEFIRNLFPTHYQFKFEIDNSTKLIPYLINTTGYSFLPDKMIEQELADKKLRTIPLLDFETPKINSYYIGSLRSKELWTKLLHK